MHRLTPIQPRAQAHRQRGITLIESLVAIVVAALGILGIVGVQMRTLTDTQTTVRRAQAIRLMEDLSERMKVNPNALQILNDTTKRANLLTTFDGTITDANLIKCSTTNACTSADYAAYDIANLKQAVASQLPIGKVQTFLAPAEADGSRRLLGVLMAWRENERADLEDDKNLIRTDKEKDASGNWVHKGGDANKCPDKFTCHLQYIPVGSRCAADANFPGQLFCPGA